MDSQAQGKEWIVGPGGCSAPVWPDPIWLPSFEGPAWTPADHGLHVLRTMENTLFNRNGPTPSYN